MTITHHQTRVCLETWINCENLLNKVASLGSVLSRKVYKIVDECAHICMGTFHAMKTYSVNIRNMAMLCVGICEECAEICESHHDAEFQQCARLSRQCSDSLSKIAFTDLQ